MNIEFLIDVLTNYRDTLYKEICELELKERDLQIDLLIQTRYDKIFETELQLARLKKLDINFLTNELKIYYNILKDYIEQATNDFADIEDENELTSEMYSELTNIIKEYANEALKVKELIEVINNDVR